MNTTKVNWIFFDALAYRDPTFDKTSLRDIDCQIASNIVYLEEKNINFERDYVLDFNNLDLANSDKLTYLIFNTYILLIL